MIDLEREWRRTPAAAQGVFLDSAGSSLSPAPVLDAVVGHLRREARIGGYRAAAERADDLAAVKLSIGRLLNAPAEAIALVESATRAWSQFFYAVPLRPGDRVLIPGVEYASNAIAALQRARASRARVEVMPSTPTGEVDLDALARTLDERVRLVSLVHVPTNDGLVNPVREVVDLARAHGALVLLDACQSVGQLAVDVTKLGVDGLSATGRKWLRGPRGTGFLYVRPDLVASLEPPVLDLHGATWRAPDRYEVHSDMTRFELWEYDVASRLGLGVAVEYLLGLGVDLVERMVTGHAARLRAALSAYPGVRVCDRGRRLSGLVTFTVDGVDPVAVRDALAERDITVSVTSRPTTLLDMTSRGLESLVRASPHYFLSPGQLDAAAAAVGTLARGSAGNG